MDEHEQAIQEDIKMEEIEHKLVDAHCHLLHPWLEKEAEEVIARAKTAGLGRIYCVGGVIGSDEPVLRLAQRHPQLVFPVIGLSPHDAPKATSQQLEEMLSLIEKNHSRIAAIGEIGLEFHYFKEDSEREKQKQVLRTQLELAETLDKPVVIHSREATTELLEHLRAFKGKVMLHCCSDPLLASEGVRRGFLVSQSTLKSRQREKIVGAIPLESLCCETDSPFLAPVRGERNEPAKVREVYDFISATKNIDFEKTVEVILENIERFFD